MDGMAACLADVVAGRCGRRGRGRARPDSSRCRASAKCAGPRPGAPPARRRTLGAQHRDLWWRLLDQRLELCARIPDDSAAALAGVPLWSARNGCLCAGSVRDRGLGHGAGVRSVRSRRPQRRAAARPDLRRRRRRYLRYACCARRRTAASQRSVGEPDRQPDGRAAHGQRRSTRADRSARARRIRVARQRGAPARCASCSPRRQLGMGHRVECDLVVRGALSHLRARSPDLQRDLSGISRPSAPRRSRRPGSGRHTCGRDRRAVPDGAPHRQAGRHGSHVGCARPRAERFVGQASPDAGHRAGHHRAQGCRGASP